MFAINDLTDVKEIDEQAMATIYGGSFGLGFAAGMALFGVGYLAYKTTEAIIEDDDYPIITDEVRNAGDRPA